MNGQRPHVDIRTTISFEDLFQAIAPLMSIMGASLEIMGWEMNMPRYCFWLPYNWKTAMDILIDCLANVAGQS